MKFIKIVAALTTLLSLLVFAADASATTLEVNGVAKNSSVTIEAALPGGVSMLLTDTGNVAANTWAVAPLVMKTSTFTGTTVGGSITGMSFTTGTEGNVTVDTAGSFSIERIGTTTNGTLRWSGSKLTIPSFFGPLTCTTSNTDIGTLSGVAAGNAKVIVNAVLPCTVIGTAKLSGTYTVTNPLGLGVTS